MDNTINPTNNLILMKDYIDEDEERYDDWFMTNTHANLQPASA